VSIYRDAAASEKRCARDQFTVAVKNELAGGVVQPAATGSPAGFVLPLARLT
jgi:hypothetical protein